MFIRVSCTYYAIMLTAVIMIQGRDGANKKKQGVCRKLSQFYIFMSISIHVASLFIIIYLCTKISIFVVLSSLIYVVSTHIHFVSTQIYVELTQIYDALT